MGMIKEKKKEKRKKWKNSADELEENQKLMQVSVYECILAWTEEPFAFHASISTG